MSKPKPYQPSNHTEGDIFRSRFCDQCPRDAAYRADPDSGIGCTIIADTMAFTTRKNGSTRTESLHVQRL